MKNAQRFPVTVVTIALFVLPSAACLPSGGGGGGGGGGFPNNASNGTDVELGPTAIVLTPPPSLTLDGQEVSSGEFVVTEATAFTFEGPMSETAVVTASDEPVIINATIGQGEHDLFEVPGATKALEVTGYFDATEPDLDVANFNVTTFADFSEPVEFTVFLPASSADTTNQVTGSTREGEETTIFTDEEVPSEAYESVVEDSGDDPGNIDTESGPLNVPQSGVAMNHHGSVQSIPDVPPAMPATNSGNSGNSCSADELEAIQRLCDVVRSENCSPYNTPTCVEDLSANCGPEFQAQVTSTEFEQCLAYAESYDFEPNPEACLIEDEMSPCDSI